MKTKLKIGGIIYSIVYKDLGDDCGHTDFSTSTIEIDEGLNEEQKNVTLVHEILHCLNNQLSENTIEFLAQGLYQVLKDNNLKKL
jgi:hypothetical protein